MWLQPGPGGEGMVSPWIVRQSENVPSGALLQRSVATEAGVTASRSLSGAFCSHRSTSCSVQEH